MKELSLFDKINLDHQIVLLEYDLEFNERLTMALRYYLKKRRPLYEDDNAEAPAYGLQSRALKDVLARRKKKPKRG